MKQRSSYHIFSIIFAIIFLQCGASSFTGCANDATVVTNTPKIADSLDIMTGFRSNGFVDKGFIGLSPDGTRLAVWYPGSLSIYETSNGKIVSEVTVDSQLVFEYCQFSLDKKKLMLSGRYPTVIYDISKNVAIVLLTLPNAYGRMYDDGLSLIAGGTYGDPPLLNIYSIPDGRVIKELHPIEYVYLDEAMLLNQSKNIIVYISALEYSAIVWSLTDDKKISSFHVDGDPNRYYFSEDGTILTKWSDLRYIHVYNALTGLEIIRLTTASFEGSPLPFSTFTKDYIYTAQLKDSIVSMNVLHITDAKTFIKKSLPNNSRSQSIAASLQQNCVAVLLTNGLVRLWRIDQ